MRIYNVNAVRSQTSIFLSTILIYNYIITTGTSELQFCTHENYNEI